MTVRIKLLGPLRVEHGDEVVTPSQPKLRQLLGLLAINAGTVVRTETITDELWGSEPCVKLARIVQTYVSQLRKLLGSSTSDSYVLSHTPRVGYVLHVGSAAYLDVDDFLRLRDRAERELAAEETEPAADTLLAGVRLCRGEVLADVSLGPVLRAHKSRLDTTRVAVLDRYLRTRLELGNAEAVLAEADRVVREDTRHEELYANLMRAFAAVGQRAEATDLFHDLRKKRVRESGLEPGQAVRAAFQQVISEEPAGMAAPSRSATVAAEVPAQIPPDNVAFRGFGAQLDGAATALTRARRVRPATLAVVGAPGVGTSTFCVHLANRTGEAFPDGQLYADLATAAPAEVLGGFIHAFRPDLSIPDNMHQRVRLFRKLTAGKRVLVVLDNVREGVDVAALQPGSPAGGMLLGCSSRMSEEVITSVVELPKLGGGELYELLSSGIGRGRVAREPEAARSLVAWCSGLPLVAALIVALARLRPHWSLARLLHKVTSTDSLVELPTGSLDLVASVQRSTRALCSGEWAALVDLERHHPGPGSISVDWTARTLDISAPAAESLLERLVEIRLADPVPPGRNMPQASYRYRIDPLYLRAVRHLAARAAPTGSPMYLAAVAPTAS
ncbi:BTAD domain-containing putative transcriptional regulator [Amycolatopsis cihanbeyliensis]|uniref:DNA-binding SARP family transcriptional activator n=1 Tax=Amycolatopsis cihanbeyliensis TaxID=1128664 RepID=A0A542DRB4_AMYCI|nr:BTAD domain-containing putative transcriptional regulator [Amycolatopsis cihanbeyliensis]TQJ05534.1 DNA-binding SARP family transcriptional activator [Amycolatopsis cihanbeyliensis]